MAKKQKHGKRKKKRTHIKPSEDEILSVPRSIVVPWGKTAKTTQPVKNLVQDWRQVMLPHTAQRLKVIKQNKISDFIKYAKGIHFTHVILFTKTSRAPYFKIARVPQGPSVSFQIDSFSLAHDVQQSLQTPTLPSRFRSFSPLVVMNNFNTPNLKLVSSLIQNMFPPINVHSIRLAECKRVLLFNRDQNDNLFEVRHYQIKTKVSSRRGEQNVDAETTYTDKSSQKDKKIKVVLQELGPRMTLRLHKIQDGPFSGETLHHEFKQYSQEELEQIQKDMKRKKDVKIKRRKEQERNVQRKKEEKEAQKKAKNKEEAEEFETTKKKEEAPVPIDSDEENRVQEQSIDMEDEKMMDDESVNSEDDEDDEDDLDLDDEPYEESTKEKNADHLVEGMEDVELDEKSKQQFQDLMNAYIDKLEKGEDLEYDDDKVEKDDDDINENSSESDDNNNDDDENYINDVDDSDEDDGLEDKYMMQHHDESSDEESEKEVKPPKKKRKRTKK